MEKIRILSLTHANRKVPVCILTQNIFSYYVGPDRSTYILASGGAILPVLESPEQIGELLDSKGNTDVRQQ